MKQKTNKQIAIHVSAVSIVVNIVLTVFKLIAGVISGSAAMISDAVHSASDVISTFVVIIGVAIGDKAPDKEHPYGHERLECIAALVLALMLGITGIGIGWSGINKIIHTASGNADLLSPGALALIAAIVSIVVKEAMYHYTKRAAVKVNSDSLMSDAWHHRSDALSSVGSFVGILGARLGFPALDPIASIVICIFIVKTAVDIMRSALSKMVDKSCDDHIIDDMSRVVTEQDGVISLDSIQTRLFGPRIYVDVEIGADGDIPLIKAHEIAQNVHDVLESEFPEVKHCMVHVNPVIRNIEEDGENGTHK